MILAQIPTQSIYLISSRDYNGEPQYLVIYGLEVSRFISRAKAWQKFDQCRDRSEECEGFGRPYDQR